MSGDSSRISPTAHYTSQVWVRAGLSDEGLGTRRGALFHAALRPGQALARPLFGGADLDSMLLLRHRAIDAMVSAELDAGASCVVEIAAGLSGRGVRFARRHPRVQYIEGDLAGMVETKRRRLASIGFSAPNHRVEVVDFLSPGGLERVVPRDARTVVITEGLLNYLPRPAVELGWERVARALAPGGGAYVAEIHLADEVARFAVARWFLRGLGAFARGAVRLHHEDVADVERAFTRAGFVSSVVVDARALVGGCARTGPTIVRVAVARV